MGRARRRKVTSHEAEEKKRKRLVMVFGIIMIFLMVFSVAGVINSGTPGTSQTKYGEYEFRLEERAYGGSVLVTEMNGQSIEFQNLPVQVSHLEVDPAAITILKESQQIVLSADPTLSAEQASLIDYVRLQFGLAFQKTTNALTQEDERYTLPVINCSHASMQMPVVLFDPTNESVGVTTDGYCITMQGTNQDIMRVKDRVIFEYFNILSNGEVVE